MILRKVANLAAGMTVRLNDMLYSIRGTYATETRDKILVHLNAHDGCTNPEIIFFPDDFVEIVCES